MSGTTRDGRSVAGALSRVLGTGSRDDFEQLLTEDVHWHGEDDAECHGRAVAGQFFSEIIGQGSLVVDDVDDVDIHDHQGADGVSGSADSSGPSAAQLRVSVTLVPHDRSARPHRHRLDLTIRDGLISRIVQAAAPPRIEVLHVDDCPNHEELLPRLRALLADHAIDADLVTIRVGSADAADRLRFLGSPTVRVNGRDVDLTAADRTGYGLQCRLYRAPDGTVAGAPSDAMILDALVDTSPAGTAVRAIHAGDLSTLRRVLDSDPDLARGPLADLGGRGLLHVATDWPGHFPNVAETIALLIAAGADPNAPGPGPHPETPLHWAASSDDIAAIDALLDGGANIETPGAVIAGGTPMADATAFGQWAAAHRLLERGARTNLWEAATLGLLPRVRKVLDQDAPTADDITHAFWGACHGSAPDTAAALLAAGADINWVGWDDLTPLDAAHRSDAPEHLITWLQDHGATSATRPPG